MTRYSGSSPAGRDGDACQAATLYTMNAMAPAATTGCGIDPEGLVCAMKPAATPAHTNKAVRPDHSNSAGGRGSGVQGRSTKTSRNSGAREAPRRAASHTPRPIASPATIGHGLADKTAMRCAPWPVSTTGANVSQAATAATSDAPNRRALLLTNSTRGRPPVRQPAPGRSTTADAASGYARDDLRGGDSRPDDSACPDDRAVTDLDAVQDLGSGADPASVSDRNPG